MSDDTTKSPECGSPRRDKWVFDCESEPTVDSEGNAEFYQTPICKRISELTATIASQAAEIERLREAMHRVLIHSVHLPGAKYELLEGLLANTKRISYAALAALPAETQPKCPAT